MGYSITIQVWGGAPENTPVAVWANAHRQPRKPYAQAFRGCGGSHPQMKQTMSYDTSFAANLSEMTFPNVRNETKHEMRKHFGGVRDCVPHARHT